MKVLAEQITGPDSSLFRRLINHLPDYVFIKDREGRIVMSNLSHARVLGFADPDAAVGKTDFDCFPRELAEQYHADEQHVMQSGETLTREEPVEDKTRGMRWLKTTKSALHNGEGQIVGVVGISRDITEQKRAEEALRRSHEDLEQRKNAEEAQRRQNAYLTALQETSLDVISQLDLDRLLENILRRAGQLMGTTTGCLDLLEPGDDHLTPKIALGVLAEESLKYRVRPGEGLAGKVWETGQSILVEDYDAWTGRIGGHQENLIQSIVEVPLMSKSGFIGVLGLAHEKGSNRHFSQETIGQLSQFARFATIAIENARLYSTMQRGLAERERAQEALRETQALHRSLVEQMPTGVFRKDREGRYVLVNPWFCRLKGMQEEEFLGKTPRELEAYELKAQEHDKLETIDKLASQGTSHHDLIMQSGQSVEVQEEYVAADGQKHFLHVVKSPVYGADGTITGTQGIMLDVTERKRIEDRLAYEQGLFQTLLQTIPDTLYFKDRECRFVRMSKSKVESTLQTVRDSHRAANPEEASWPAHLADTRAFAAWLTGKTDFDTYPEAYARAALEDEQEIMRTGQPVVGKLHKALLPNGQTVWKLSTKLPWRDKDGNIIGTFGISKDVTAIKKAEEALAQERALLRTIVDNLPDAIYAKDLECRKILVNPADLKNLRCRTEAEAVGKNDFDLFPRDIAAKFYADDQAVIHGEPVHNREEYFFDEENRQHWLLTSKLPLRNQDGRIIGLVGIGRDITAIKDAERKLEALHRELLTASRQAGMADVATGVLHNVGNVLNSVNVSAALIDDQLRNSRIEGVERVARLLHEQGANLSRYLTEDERGRHVPVYLEELAKYLEQERAELRKEVEALKGNIGHIKDIVAMQQENARMFGVVETLPLSDLVEDALKLNGAGYARHGVTVKREYDPLPIVAVDKHKALQILVNLLSNAKYACDAGRATEKRVVVRLKAGDEGRVRIEVADNGVGIASDNLTRIFSQGYTTRKGGHGFGLHTSALAAGELGGALTVHSEGLGQGATFTLELPVTPPVASVPSADDSKQIGLE